MNKAFKKVARGAKIIVAVSGGPDSVYLLDQCVKLDSKPEIIVAHLNHKLRPISSDLDAAFVQKLSKKFKLKFEGKTIDIREKKGNLEEKGRQARYDFFEQIRQKYQADWILTGHHLNDQIETILFNLTRGIHSNGLKGIAAISKQRKILRPLLSIEKKEILAYLKKNKIKFRQDKSNFDLKLSRNLIRHKIIPLFHKLNPNFNKTFLRTIENLQQNNQFTNDYAKSWIEKCVTSAQSELKFDLQTFLNNQKIIQTKIILALFKKINQTAITIHQLEEILKILQAEKSNRWKEFGSGSKITIKKNSQTDKREVVILNRIK